MIFALATDERTLKIFSDADEAISYCEGIDVEEGGWEFWEEGGRALSASFSKPNERSRWFVSSGAYSLQPNPDRPDLLASLPQVRQLDANPHFASVAALADHLAKSSKLQDHDA